jgi:hypothetical protein
MKINHILSPVTEPVTEFVAGMFCLERTVVDLDVCFQTKTKLRTVGVGELITAQLSNIRISRIHKIYNISSYDIRHEQQHHVDYSALCTSLPRFCFCLMASCASLASDESLIQRLLTRSLKAKKVRAETVFVRLVLLSTIRCAAIHFSLFCG